MTAHLALPKASNIEKATIDVKKQVRSGMSGGTAPAPKPYTEAEKNACSIDARLNGGECEACQ